MCFSGADDDPEHTQRFRRAARRGDVDGQRNASCRQREGLFFLGNRYPIDFIGKALLTLR